jgi:hypothetical protein
MNCYVAKTALFEKEFGCRPVLIFMEDRLLILSVLISIFLKNFVQNIWIWFIYSFDPTLVLTVHGQSHIAFGLEFWERTLDHQHVLSWFERFAEESYIRKIWLDFGSYVLIGSVFLITKDQ